MNGVKIQEELCRRVRSREFAPGSKIPSLRELSQSFDVSHALVQQAVRGRVAEGYLESEVGRGTFVPASPIAAKTVALVDPHLRSKMEGDLKVSLNMDMAHIFDNETGINLTISEKS